MSADKEYRETIQAMIDATAAAELERRLKRQAMPPREERDPVLPADLVGRYPTLVHVLTLHLKDEALDDGATLTLWGATEGLGAVLNIKPWGVKCFLLADTLQGLLEAAENQLTDPEAKWRKEGDGRRHKRPAKQRSGKPH